MTSIRDAWEPSLKLSLKVKFGYLFGAPLYYSEMAVDTAEKRVLS